MLTELRDLCWWFEVVSTGTTFKKVKEIVEGVDFGCESINRIQKSADYQIQSPNDLESNWKTIIREGLEGIRPQYPGMIQMANELILGRLNAVIHLMDWDDVPGKPDSAVLRRQANVHHVPIANDVKTARAMISGWKSRTHRSLKEDETFFNHRRLPIPEEDFKKLTSQLEKLKRGDNILGLIAYDGLKLEMCCFVVQHATKILQHDVILATGETGSWIRRFLRALGRSEKELEKIICCLSGSLGGDIQIAWAVVQEICKKVIFFQDPMATFPHETDIKLFEQAVLTPGIEIALAPNPETAVDIL